jgi:hypothetical protein
LPLPPVAPVSAKSVLPPYAPAGSDAAALPAPRGNPVAVGGMS